ncbi:MAG TPA: hypothetical protein VMB05_01720, partial [Solirubrobacteraceae bacterium]|nr:hypothetical protein [Solirubrobacteraceae bacterium]
MRIKLAALLVLAITAVGIVSTGSALAVELPDIQLLSGEAFPLVLKGETASKKEQAVLETELGEKLTAEHVIIEIEWGSLSSLALFHVHFLEVEEPRTKSLCNTSGDEPGKVLISGEFHTVFLIVGPPWVIHGDIL